MAFASQMHTNVTLPHTIATVSDDDVAPPAYDTSEIATTPLYSAYPGMSETTLQQGSPVDSYESTSQALQARISTSSPLSTEPWIFESKYMHILIENRRWNTEHPTIGLKSVIQGSLELRCKSQSVDRVTVSFNGYLTTSVPQKSGLHKWRFLTVSSVLYDASGGAFASPDPQSTYSFELAVPTQVQLEQDATLSETPPSFFCSSCSASCEVSYQLTVSIDRKPGSGVLSKHESKSVTILYLPKSTPCGPPLTVIPRPPSIHHSHISPNYLHVFDRVETASMPIFWPVSVKKPDNAEQISKEFMNSVHFSIPSPRSYTSGDQIPYAFSLVFPKNPTLNSLLSHCLRVTLIKQLFVYGKPSRHQSTPQLNLYREFPVATGKLKSLNEYSEGITLLRGFIAAGEAGKERSWKLSGNAGVSYILRAYAFPPKNMQTNIPSFKYEVPVEIVTDEWGALERELQATGGEPTPALGLMESTMRFDNDAYLWAYSGL